MIYISQENPTIDRNTCIKTAHELEQQPINVTYHPIRQPISATGAHQRKGYVDVY